MRKQSKITILFFDDSFEDGAVTVDLSAQNLDDGQRFDVVAELTDTEAKLYKRLTTSIRTRLEKLGWEPRESNFVHKAETK